VEEWLARRAPELRAMTRRHGAVLVRSLPLDPPARVERLLAQLAGTLVEEVESIAPRRRSAGLYSSSHWPHNEPMCPHHESSYVSDVPRLMLFACLAAPAVGGAFLLADSVLVADRLPRTLTARFEATGWSLTRCYSPYSGTSWQQAFGTDDPATVAAYCRAHDIAHEWRNDVTLLTRRRRPALVRHPDTGQPSWCNQIAFLSRWTMDAAVRDYLLAALGADGLPFDTGYGDGGDLAEETVRAINETYDRLTVRVPLRAGDLLLVDNLRMAHGREAYEPPRELLVGMAEPVRFRGADGVATVASAPGGPGVDGSREIGEDRPVE
jgi:alpha-ketoglutarate-dependent taurine dioxygenase